METLCHAEELRRALDHRPSRVDTVLTWVAKHRGQHLSNTAASRGGVDVPHCVTRETLGHKPGTCFRVTDNLQVQNFLETP